MDFKYSYDDQNINKNPPKKHNHSLWLQEDQVRQGDQDLQCLLSVHPNLQHRDHQEHPMIVQNVSTEIIRKYMC